MSFQEKPVVSIISLKKEKMNTQTAPPSGKSSILQGETWCSARMRAMVISAQANPPMPRCAHLSSPQSEKRPLKKFSILFIYYAVVWLSSICSDACFSAIAASCSFFILSASSIVMSFQFSALSVDASHISSEKIRSFTSTSALYVSRQPSLGLNILTSTCLIFVSINSWF